jgi:serine/threonine-protein kinase RsbT
MPVSAETSIPISNDDDIVLARQYARQIAKELGFGMVDQARIATAVSELSRNVVRYATDGRGNVIIRAASDGSDRQGIEVVVSDDGPGIADVDRVMQEGFSSGRGLGMGLSGTKRLMDEMNIDSVVGRGTTITIRRWRR